MILSLNGIIAGRGATPSTLLNNLIAAYNAENDVNDSLGLYNGSGLGGLTYSTGISGNAFQFNGTTSYVSIPNISNQFNFTNDFSLSLWVYFNSVTANYELFFSNYKTGGTYGSGYNLYTDGNNLVFDLNSQSSTASYKQLFIPSTNQWYNIVITRKKSSLTKMYINNILQSATYTNGNALVNPTYQGGEIYNIGSYNNGSLLSNIRLDAINLWDRELTSTEVTELYNSGAGKFYPF